MGGNVAAIEQVIGVKENLLIGFRFIGNIQSAHQQRPYRLICACLPFAQIVSLQAGLQLFLLIADTAI